MARRVADPEGPSAGGDEPFAQDSYSEADVETDRQNRRAWRLSGERDAPVAPPLGESWQRLASRLGLGQPARRSHSLRLVRFGQFAVAASLVAAVVLLWPRPPDPAPETSMAGMGEQVRVELADGSVVVLNSGSVLEHFSATGASARTVVLDGEAFFEVRPSDIPFRVETSEATVTVLGTRFGVRSRDEATRVYVESGTVEVSDGEGSVRVGAQEVAERVAGAPVRRVSTGAEAAEFAWTEGGIAFVRMRVEDVLAEIVRRSGRSIRLGRTDLADRTVTATFPDFELESVLEAICLSLECRVEYGEAIVIR
jgi:transmembrane sensor